MKKYLLPEGGNYYKANLHCHSVISDGSWTPEEIKKNYMAQGYSVVAYTDHDIMLPHHDLTDEHFLALTGYEMEINAEQPDSYCRKTCHMCFIALDPTQTRQVCWNRDYLFGHALEYLAQADFDPALPPYIRRYTPECINEMYRIGRENGFFTTYNHPDWSREDYRDYIAYEGMDAMEIVNFGCVYEGYADHNGRVYDDMLRAGKRIACVATDDNHNRHADSFGGYVMIKAPCLEYRAITAALKAGDYYASEKPEIHDLWVEDGQVHVTTSPARRICYIGGRRVARTTYPDGNPVTGAVFSIDPADGWFRLEVEDAEGYRAYTSAYFTDTL